MGVIDESPIWRCKVFFPYAWNASGMLEAGLLEETKELIGLLRLVSARRESALGRPRTAFDFHGSMRSRKYVNICIDIGQLSLGT